MTEIRYLLNYRSLISSICKIAINRLNWMIEVRHYVTGFVLDAEPCRDGGSRAEGPLDRAIAACWLPGIRARSIPAQNRLRKPDAGSGSILRHYEPERDLSGQGTMDTKTPWWLSQPSA